jgi:hypothetical protein
LHQIVQVGAIIADALASLRMQVAAQGIAVTTDIDPTLPQAELDYAQIEQVLLALMSNAIEAMPRGGRLAVSARRAVDGARLYIVVADTGPGIPPDQIPHLFDLFVTGKPSGTGLGLAFAKRIVDCTAAASRPRASWHRQLLHHRTAVRRTGGAARGAAAAPRPGEDDEASPRRRRNAPVPRRRRGRSPTAGSRGTTSSPSSGGRRSQDR